MRCKAIRYDDTLAGLEQGCCQGQVMGVYERCFHLLLEDQRLVTVFGAAADMMPLSICTDTTPDRPFASLKLLEGMRAGVCEGVLSVPAAGLFCRLGGEPISLLRRPLPPPGRPAPFEAALLRHGKRQGGGQCLPQWIESLRTGSPPPAAPEALARFAAFLTAVGGGGTELREALWKTVGLGVGLTPSADDMICGAAAAAWLWWPKGLRSRFLGAILEFCRVQGRARTTLISCQQMEQTAQGRLSDPLYALAECLSGGKDSLDRAVERVSAYGSSSGTELCMGLLAGLYVAAAC